MFAFLLLTFDCILLKITEILPCYLMRRHKEPKVSLLYLWTRLLHQLHRQLWWEAKVQIFPPASLWPQVLHPAEQWELNTNTKKHNETNIFQKNYFDEKCQLSDKMTYVAVGFVIFSSCSDGAVVQHVHDPFKVALIDDAAVVSAGLWVICVELLQKRIHNWRKSFGEFLLTFLSNNSRLKDFVFSCL